MMIDMNMTIDDRTAFGPAIMTATAPIWNVSTDLGAASGLSDC